MCCSSNNEDFTGHSLFEDSSNESKIGHFGFEDLTKKQRTLIN